MSEGPAGDIHESESNDGGSEALDEMREAATAVLDSLKSLLVAAEKVVSDPSAFNQAVAGGKGLFDAFTSGFSDQSGRSDPPPKDV